MQRDIARRNDVWQLGVTRRRCPVREHRHCSGLEPTRIRGKPDGAKQGRAAADVKLTPENPVQTLYWLGAATLAGVIEASLHFDITVLVVILCRFLVTFPRRCSNRNQGKVHALSHGDEYALSASVLIGIKRLRRNNAALGFSSEPSFTSRACATLSRSMHVVLTRNIRVQELDVCLNLTISFTRTRAALLL